MSLILHRPHKDKDTKKLLHRLKPVPHEYSKNWLQSHRTEKTYQSNHFYWYYYWFRCFITLPFLLSAQVYEKFGLFTLHLVLLLHLLWREVFLVPSNLAADYVRQMTYGHCHHYLLSSFCLSTVTQCPCAVMFRHPGSIKLLQKNTNSLSVKGRKHLRDKHSSCENLSVHNRKMLAHLEFMVHLWVHIQNDDSSISVLIFKEDFCYLLIHRTSASVCHQRYIHSIVSQDYLCWSCHSSWSFFPTYWQMAVVHLNCIPPSQDTEGWLTRNSQHSACHAAAWTVQESLDPRVSSQGVLSGVWALKCVRAGMAKIVVRPCLHQDRFQTGSMGNWGTGFPFCYHSIKTYQAITQCPVNDSRYQLCKPSFSSCTQTLPF